MPRIAPAPSQPQNVASIFQGVMELFTAFNKFLDSLEVALDF
jgi:hypothetical protein